MNNPTRIRELIKSIIEKRLDPDQELFKTRLHFNKIMSEYTNVEHPFLEKSRIPSGYKPTNPNSLKKCIFAV
jgi:hypothetical protein